MSSIGHYPVGMMKRPPYLAGILLFALVFGAEPAHAAQVVSLTLEQVVDRADVIAWGTVTEAASELVPGAPGRIQTRITLLPSQRLAGAPGQDTAAPVIFYVAGGVMGRIGQVVPGSPRVRVGDEVVMLLSRQAISHRLIVVGLAQGHYRVERRAGGPVVAVSDRRELGLLLRDAQGRLSPADVPSVEREPLQALLTRIRARLQATGR